MLLVQVAYRDGQLTVAVDEVKVLEELEVRVPRKTRERAITRSKHANNTRMLKQAMHKKLSGLCATEMQT